MPARPLSAPAQPIAPSTPVAKPVRALQPIYMQNSATQPVVSQAIHQRPAVSPRSLPAQPLQPAPPVAPVQPAVHHRAVLERSRLHAAAPQPVPTQQLPTPKPAAPVVATPQPAPQPAPTRRIPFDMALPGADSPSALARLSQARWRGLRQWSLRGAAIAVVLVITTGGLLFSQGFLKVHKVFKGSTGTAAALKANVDPSLLKGEGSGRVNILLLGRGGGTHNAPDLTDTMMIASVDPINHTTSLVSIPRDLWVNVPDAGVMKINAVWETGVYKYLGKIQTNTTNGKAIQAGYDEVDQVVSNVLGVNIDYNAIVDFTAFKQAIDTVGGVSLDVPTDLVDPTMAWENNNDPVLAHAGIHNFTGTQALMYARSRETSSDFARSQRQRQLLLALKDKVDTLGTLSNPLKISKLLSAFGNNVSTDLSIKDASRLYSILHQVGDTGITSVGLADDGNSYVTTGNMNGQSIVLPKAGLFNYGDIQSYIRSQLKDPFIVKEHAKIEVLNGTTLPGLASTKANELKAYGYNVTYVGNTPNTGWTQTTLVDLTHKSKYTRHYLEEHYNQTASNSLADSTIPTNGADFVIIIGSDEATTPTAQAN